MFFVVVVDSDDDVLMALDDITKDDTSIATMQEWNIIHQHCRFRLTMFFLPIILHGWSNLLVQSVNLSNTNTSACHLPQQRFSTLNA